jgi:AraC-like DNA-binding protein/quercetin dioxygenase-like cupin family protein
VRRTPPLPHDVRVALGHPRPPPRGSLAVSSMGRMAMAPGDESDLWHSHHELWEVQVQAEGQGTEHLGGEAYALEPGDLILVPPGALHGTVNGSRRTLFQYVIHFEANRVPLLERERAFCIAPGRPLLRLGPESRLWFEQLFHQLWWEETMRQPGFETAEDALLRLLLLGLARLAGGQHDAPARQPRPDVLRFMNHVRDALSQPKPLHVAATQLGTNYDSLRHRFKQELGVSPREFVTNLRLQQAKHLLLSSRLTVKEISSRLGYASPHHFTAAFTRHAGKAPLHWRRRPDLRTY